MEDPKQFASASERIIQFLKDFVPDQGSPTGEENLNIQLRSSIVGSYHLSQVDIYPEVLDWVSSYLDQKKCPSELCLVLSTEVATHIKDSFPIIVNEQDPEAEFMLDSVLLYNNVLEKLNELCNNYQNTPDEILTKIQLLRTPRHLTSVSAIKNGRRKMEDRHVVIHDLNAICGLENSPPHSYYAVFDGHAGVDAASYAASHLHWNIVGHPAFSTDLETAIKEAYIQTDEAFLERSRRDNIKSGCTAVTCLIRDKTLYVAWLGDSLAILVRQGMPISLVEPHKPDKLEERQRIEKLGGLVAYVGTWRVNGTLAVSRAIGDIEHKPMVTSLPDIQKIPLEGNEDFLVIGCDGLWDHMSPNDVSASVYSKATDLTSDVDSIASCIVQQSKNQGSTDNITAIVVLFRERASLTEPLPSIPAPKNFTEVAFDHFASNGKLEIGDYTQGEGPFSNNPFSQTWMENPAESLESGKSIYVYNSGITVGDPIGANGPEEIFRPFTGVTLERTSISELPTPPIEDVAPHQQFSSLESMNPGLEQSSNPFSLSGNPQAEDIASNLLNYAIENAFTQKGLSNQASSLKEDLLSTNVHSDILESQTTVMVSSQIGQSHLTAVPESDDSVPASKPWMMQVEHSHGQNEVDYLPNAEASDFLGQDMDMTGGSQEPKAAPIYDFMGTMQLEEVPLDVGTENLGFDPLQQVDMPVGSEIEASYRETESFQADGDLVSSLSEEAPSTLRAIHGIQEMIGISESVPGSKAQNPPATAGNPFSDNPFSIQKAFGETLPSPVDGEKLNVVSEPLEERVDTLGELLSTVTPDIHHESLIESNVDPPEDELVEAPTSMESGLPDVLLPTLEKIGHMNQTRQDSVDLKLEDLIVPEVYPVSDVPTELVSPLEETAIDVKKDETNLSFLDDFSIVPAENMPAPPFGEFEGTLPSAPENLLIPEVELLNAFVTTEEQTNYQDQQDLVPPPPLAPFELKDIQDTPVGLKEVQDTLEVTLAGLKEVQDTIEVKPTELKETIQVTLPTELKEARDMSQITPTALEANFIESLTTPEKISLPIIELSNLESLSKCPKSPITELASPGKESFPGAFSTQPETVKVDFSPTLSSEPTTKAVVSPIIGSVPITDMPGSQDTLTAPVVQLGKIPDGVPEADGVTEDVDSDSEKDGGWSYVKGTDGKTIEKTAKKAETVEKNGAKLPLKKSVAAVTNTTKRPGTKETTKSSTVMASPAKPMKQEDKTKKSSPVSVKAATSTLAKKSPITQPTDTIKKVVPSSATLKGSSLSSGPNKTMKAELPKTKVSLSTVPAIKSTKPPSTITTAKTATSTLAKKTTIGTSTLKSGTMSTAKTVSSSTTSVAPKPITKPAVSGKTTVGDSTSTLSKTSRPVTAPTLGKSTETKTAITKTVGSVTSSKAVATKITPVGTKTTTTSAISTLTKTASSTTTKTTSATASRTVTNVTKVTKKPVGSPILTTKSPTEPKQTKETINKQMTRQTGTMGKTTTTSTLNKLSTMRTTAKPASGTLKSKTVAAKPDTGTKSVTRPPSNKGAVNLVNGNAEAIAKEGIEAKDSPVSVVDDQSKEPKTIQPSTEAEKGLLEENHKEMPAVDSGLASPESLESPQNGLVSGDSNVTNSASMQNDKNEIFNQ